MNTTPQNNKATFAPLPARAIGDQRLTGIHFRVLAAICLHDRMSGALGKGQGCWASHKTLATKCGCHYTNLSTAIKQLAKFGYVERSPLPMNKRQWVYRVIYTDDDKTIAKTPNSLPVDKRSSPEVSEIVCPDGDTGGTIVCPDFSEAVQFQDVRDVEYIPRSEEEITKNVKRNSVETASLSSDGGLDVGSTTEVGTFLRKAEASLSNSDISESALNDLGDELMMVIECYERGDRLHGWARRLLERIEDLSDRDLA